MDEGAMLLSVHIVLNIIFNLLYKKGIRPVAFIYIYVAVGRPRIT